MKKNDSWDVLDRSIFRNLSAVLVLICCCLNLLSFGGCSQSAPDSERGSKDVQALIDPRMQTAQALANYAKELLEQSPPDKSALFRTLFYWETEEQRIWQRHLETIVLPIAQLNDVAMIHFGEGLSKSIQFAEFEIRDTKINKNQGGRAEGAFYDEAGHEHVLHLVEIDSRWWISGFTIEYAGVEFLELIGGSTSDLTIFDKFTLPQITVTADIKNRILREEFKDIYEASEAMRIGMESIKRD